MSTRTTASLSREENDAQVATSAGLLGSPFVTPLVTNKKRRAATHDINALYGGTGVVCFMQCLLRLFPIKDNRFSLPKYVLSFLCLHDDFLIK